MENAGGLIFGLFMGIIGLAFIILMLVSYWKLFEKMGEEGWKGLIPIYNMIVIAEKVGKPAYWGVLTIIPYVGLVWGIWLLNLWFKKFGKDELFTVLTMFFGFITIPMLAFGDAKWLGDGGENNDWQGPTPQESKSL